MIIETAKKKYLSDAILSNKNSGTILWKAIKQTTGQQVETELIAKIRKANNIVLPETKKI